MSPDERISALRLALREACDLLEGWINFKCPRQYKQEHREHLAKLRQVYADQPGEVPELDPADCHAMRWLESHLGMGMTLTGFTAVADGTDEYEVTDAAGQTMGTGPTLRLAIEDARNWRPAL